MNKRITWINTIIFLALLLAAIFFMPQRAPATSNSESDTNNADVNLRYLESVYKLLQENYVDEIDPSLLYKGAMEGMLNSLQDPYTSYIFRDTTVGHDLEDTTTGVFGGIGVHITKANVSTPERPAYVEVASPIEGTPGWRAGLQPGDYIIEIDGVKTEDITQEDVLNMLRGKEGTQVTIKVLRGKNLKFDLTLTRAIIEVPTIKYTKIGKDIAYIRLIEFNPNSAKRITEAIEKLQEEGCTKLIFDLKNNPGGLITSSIDVASIFLESGVVVSTKGRARNTSETYNVRRFVKKLPKDMPIVVLINEGSASASEIVAGALKDHKRAYLVGTRSYGKGLVQSVVQLSEKELVKLTIARYYSPSGANINKQGILPDLEVTRPSFTPDEEKSVLELLKTSKIANFTRSKSSISKNEMVDFSKKLGKEYNVRHELILSLVKVEYYRSHESPVIDEDDEQLQAAINLLRTKDVNTLCKTTKTLFEMQEEEKARTEEKAKTEDKK